MERNKVIAKIAEVEEKPSEVNELLEFLKLVDNIKATSQWEYLRANNEEVIEKRNQMFFLKKELVRNFNVLVKLTEIKPEVNNGTFI